MDKTVRSHTEKPLVCKFDGLELFKMEPPNKNIFPLQAQHRPASSSLRREKKKNEAEHGRLRKRAHQAPEADPDAMATTHQPAAICVDTAGRARTERIHGMQCEFSQTERTLLAQ